MDTLFNAISQQEQEQQKQKEAEQQQTTAPQVTTPQVTNTVHSTPSEPKVEPNDNNLGIVNDTNSTIAPATQNADTTTIVPAEGKQESVQVTEAEGQQPQESQAPAGEPEAPTSEANVVENTSATENHNGAEPAVAKPEITEQHAIDTPAANNLLKDGFSDSQQKINGAQNKDASSETVVEPVTKKQKLDTEETVIKPSADAIESIKEQEKIRQEEENETLEKVEKSAESIPKEKVVRQVEEDDDYDD